MSGRPASFTASRTPITFSMRRVLQSSKSRGSSGSIWRRWEGRANSPSMSLIDQTDMRTTMSAGQPACRSLKIDPGGRGVRRLRENSCPLMGVYVIVGRSTHVRCAPAAAVSPPVTEPLMLPATSVDASLEYWLITDATRRKTGTSL